MDKYQYSLEEVDTEFFELKKYKDPDVRYYACVVDKNRAGAKPKVVFRLNLAYNMWEELGYLRLLFHSVLIIQYSFASPIYFFYKKLR